MLYYIETEKQNNIYRIKHIINQATGEIISLLDFLMQTGNVYVNNLNFAFMEIIKELLKLKYRNVFDAKKPGQFSFAYKGGECLQIKVVKDAVKTLRLINFEKKFLQEHQDTETSLKLIKYARENERFSASLGNDAFNEFLSLTFRRKNQRININACRELFRQDYPIIKEPMLETAKAMTSGYQLAKPGLYENIYNYDIVSSYPAQLVNDTPIGAPKEYKSFDEMPKSYFYVVRATFLHVELKDGCIDFANANKRNAITLILTEHLYKLFLHNYTFAKVKIKRIIGFKTIKNRFDAFLYKNIYQGKINGNFKPIIKYNKAIANSVVGYFGKNQVIEQTKLLRKDGKIAIITGETIKEPVYLPLYLYVTGKAKSEFIMTLQRVGLDKVVYANTDGFLASAPVNVDRLNIGRNDELGTYKQKQLFTSIYIECVNGYCALASDGTLDNTLSGMRTPNKITVEQYRNKHFTYLVNYINEYGELQEYEIQR